MRAIRSSSVTPGSCKSVPRNGGDLEGRDPAVDLVEFTVRIILAIGLGAAIGIERQYRQSGAGLRRNALVAMGAAATEAGRVRIEAEIAAGTRRDQIIEEMTSRLSFEPGVTAISWEILEPQSGKD
jgi:uncharacterized membrane protein YhiD involved in acid resistance